MKSGLFVLYLAAGFILECSATIPSTIIWNMRDNATNKTALCANECCRVVANHEVIITVTWFFEGSIDRPSVTLSDKGSILHRSPTTVVYYLCKPQTGTGIAIMIKACNFMLKGGNYTFDLPVLKASSKVQAMGPIVISYTRVLFSNFVTIIKE